MLNTDFKTRAISLENSIEYARIRLIIRASSVLMASLVVINIINPWAWRSSTSSQVLNLLQIATSLFLSKWSCKLPSSATRNSNWGLRVTCRSLPQLPGRVRLFCTRDKHMKKLVLPTRYFINLSENKPQSLTAFFWLEN